MGNVVRADILFLPNGRSKGQGTILFETKEEATKAIGSPPQTLSFGHAHTYGIHYAPSPARSG